MSSLCVLIGVMFMGTMWFMWLRIVVAMCCLCHVERFAMLVIRVDLLMGNPQSYLDSEQETKIYILVVLGFWPVFGQSWAQEPAQRPRLEQRYIN